MYVKICGLRDAVTARHAIDAGADAVGVVMSDGSPRNATDDEARAVVTAAREQRGSVDTVLVVRGMDAVTAAERARDLGFDVLQLHGDYSSEDFAQAAAIHPRIWRATSLASHPNLHAGEFAEERLLVDSAVPGSGELWDRSAVHGAQLGNDWLLAGGLTPTNVAQAIADTHPAGVDVSSGVESSPGVKDLELITQFIEAARSA